MKCYRTHDAGVNSGAFHSNYGRNRWTFCGVVGVRVEAARKLDGGVGIEIRVAMSPNAAVGVGILLSLLVSPELEIQIF